MHWFEQLSQMYLPTDTPLYHAVQQTDIEIHLDICGSLLRVRSESMPTLIPVSIASMYRTRAIEPHPLSDKLMYLAAGYSKLHHDAYLKAISSWADSEWSTPRLQAVSKYIHLGTLPHDIAHIQTSGDTAIRFVVDSIPLWQDTELIAAHISRTKADMQNNGFCCVTGDIMPLCHSHPKRITCPSSNAKLISHEHRRRIIYQGRYSSPQEMFTIGADTSFKAHTVLRRIISEHGMQIGNRTFAAWDDLGALPLPFSRTAPAPSGTVTVIGFAEATKGRLSVTFLRRITSDNYRITAENWRDLGLTCREVVLAAFGRQGRNGLICSDELLGSTAERLLACIIDGSSLPADMQRALRLKAPHTAERICCYNSGELYEKAKV